jgi:hypothetical protein
MRAQGGVSSLLRLAEHKLTVTGLAQGHVNGVLNIIPESLAVERPNTFHLLVQIGQVSSVTIVNGVQVLNDGILNQFLNIGTDRLARPDYSRYTRLECLGCDFTTSFLRHGSVLLLGYG